MTGWPALYDITDDWLAADRPADRAARLPPTRAWLLDATREQSSRARPSWCRRKSPQRPADGIPIDLIPNAVDVAAYRRPDARPADLPAGRCAVYVGTLHADRFDVALCVQTARALAGDAAVVLVGPNVLAARTPRG